MESAQERAIQTADSKICNQIINENKSSLQWAKRIDFRNLDYAVVEEVVMKKGHPLVITNTTLSWKRDRHMFGWDWLKKHFGTTYIRPRNIQTFVDLPECPLSQYLNYMADPDYSQGILYAKDVPCPAPWKDFISQKLSDFWCRGDNDLLGELAKELQPETLLIYLGMDATCTPGHTDILGSLGNNIMVYADSDAYALWACVGTQDRDKAALYWKNNSSNSDGTLYSDNVLLSVDTLSKAPFPVFMIEQREGDLVLLPPECAHQVINKNGRNVKVAWNTINYLSIENSYFSAVPLYRSIGKPQLYRVKAVAYSSLLTRLREACDTKSFRENLVEEFPPLLTIVEDMLHSESIAGQDDLVVQRFTDEHAHTRTCDFCKGDIWNRCYHCNLCNGEDGYDICQACVAEGRGCSHKDKLVLMEHFPIKVIKEKLEESKDAYQKVLKIVKRKKGKKKLEEWKSRTITASSAGTLAHQVAQLYRKENTEDTCHQCEKLQPYIQTITVGCKSKGAGCGKKYCSRCLWNRYAIKLIDCLRDSQWSCPACQTNCNCNPCLEQRGISPSSFSCESVLSEALEASYPFQTLTAPNVPCVSDFKPVVHSLALKKRKFAYTASSAPTTPTAPKSPPDLAKMTERQQIKYLTQSASFTEPPSTPPKIQRSASSSSIPDEPPRTPIKLEQPPIKKETPQPNGHPLHSNNNNDTPSSQKQQSPWNTQDIPKSAPPASLSSTSSQDVWKPTPTKYSGWDNPNVPERRASETTKEGPDHQTTILVRNLHYSTTNQDLQDLFQDCGVVDNVTVPVDKSTGKLKGYGFVKFRTRESAELAMKKHNYANVRDRAIEIEWSVDKVSQLRGDARLVCYKCGANGHMAKLCPLNSSSAHQNTWVHRPPRFAKDIGENSSSSSSYPDNYSEALPEKDREWWGRESSRESLSNSRDSSSSYYRSDDRDRYDREKDRRDYNPSSSSYDSTWENKESYSVDRDSQQLGAAKIHRGYICFKCGKEGHVALECKQRSDTGPGFRGVVCFKCGQGGHLANKCDKKVRGCFICGKDGHIAVECTSERAAIPSDPQQLSESYSYSNNGSSRDSAWDTSPNKQRKLTSSSSPGKDNSWEDRDRERTRERKSGWDAPPRDPRDPRYSDNNPTSSSNSSSYYPTRRDDPTPSRREDERNPRDPRYQQTYQEDSYSRYSANSATKNGYPSTNGNNTSSPPAVPAYSTQPPASTFGGMGAMSMPGMNMNSLGMNLAMPLINSAVNSAAPNVSANLLSLFASGQIPLNPLNASSLQSLTQTITNLGNPPAASNLTSSSEKSDDGAKKYWKHYATNIVVSRLSKFYNSGKFASKEDFKQLSKKVTTFLVNKFDGRYATDKDTEAKIKKYVENYFEQYVMELQRGTQASWLASD